MRTDIRDDAAKIFCQNQGGGWWYSSGATQADCLQYSTDGALLYEFAGFDGRLVFETFTGITIE